MELYKFLSMINLSNIIITPAKWFYKFPEIVRVLTVTVVGGVVLSSCTMPDIYNNDQHIKAPEVENQVTSITPTTEDITATPKGEVYGNGNTRVALLIPETALGNGAIVAKEIRSGALIAMHSFASKSIELVIKDTAGQAVVAQRKVAEAINEGASIILGPVFSENVDSVAAVTRSSGHCVIAFSTDETVARRCVYLLSFTPQDDVKRVIDYATSQGKKSILAFLPKNNYGAVVEATLREVAGRNGVSIVHIAKYERSPEGIDLATKNAKKYYYSADTLYIPEGGNIPSAIIASIGRLDLKTDTKQIIGSGLWESVDTSDQNLSGAIYAGRDLGRFQAFSDRYSQVYGTVPSVNAALGYDAVSLITELINRHGNNAFSPYVIENKNGFAGVSGIFRFVSGGTTQRGLVIYQIIDGERKILAPSPDAFDL